MKNLFLILIGFCLIAVGCQKEPLQTVENSDSTAAVVIRTLKTGEDDEPIIHGVIVDENGGSVSGAQVELIEDGYTTPVETVTSGSNGSFSFQAPAADYFIKVTPVGQNPVETDVFTLSANSHMTIEI